MLKRFVGLGAVCLLFALVLLPLEQVAGQGRREEWSAPTVLGDGWWQSIATDQQGTTHLAWYGIITTPTGIVHDVMKYANLPLDGTWTRPNDVIYTGDGGYTVRNAIAVTSDGTLAAVFRARGNHEFSSAPVQTAWNAASWSPWKAIDPEGYYVNMTVDHNDVLHIAYSTRLTVSDPFAGNPEAHICAFCHDLYYRHSTDEGKTWSDPVAISTLPDTGSDRMNIFEGQSGRLYIDWDEGVDWYIGRGEPKDVRIVYSDDGGLTWSAPIILPGNSLDNLHPIQVAVTEMANKAMMAVWRYPSNADPYIYYQISEDNGVTWTVPTPIDGMVARNILDPVLDDYNLVTDKLGIVHLFAVGRPSSSSGQNATLYHVTYHQGRWTSPFPVFYSPDYWPEWPKAAIGLQNDIHLSWFSRGIREGQPVKSYTDILKIFYSHLPGSFPPLVATATFSPTQTPLPTSGAFAVFDPTLTPYPTLDNYRPGIIIQTEDNMAASIMLGGLLASGLFCAAVFIFIRYRRH